jgi:16S rRNA (guanine966-N2)-methyltransferase
VAGLAGGRRLAVPGRGTRPTADRVREALFSAVESAVDLDGARVLDLYAGSGALGLEALSRGAAAALFVESNPTAAAVLADNVRAVGLGGTVRRAKVATVLAETPDAPYDLVLADPPYADPIDATLRALVAGSWVAPGGLVIVERDARGGPPDWPEPLAAMRVRRYGDTELHWARHA